MSSEAERRRPARELALAALFFLAITVLLTWPQAAHLADALSDVGDAKLNARTLQWDYAQTLRDPLNLYQLNFFYPAKYVLAFSENLYGVAVFGFPLLAGGATALLNYNVLLLLGMYLSALSAWSLAREITGDPLASVAAGLVFAFLPWRFAQLAHLQFQWAAFLPLCLLFLLRYLERGRRRDAVFFGAAFAWNAFCNVHYAIFGAFLVGVALGVSILQGQGDARRWRGALLATAVGGAVFVPFALPYFEASRLYGMRRYFGEVLAYSGRWTDFLSAGERNWLYGASTARWRGAEGDFFPGLFPLVLAAVAVVRLRASRPRASPASPPSKRRLRAARVLDALVVLLTVACVWSRLQPGLRIGPLHLEDPGRILVLLTLLVLVRLVVAFPARSASRSLADFARTSRLDRRALLLLTLAAVGVLIALGGHTPYYRFLFQSFGSVFRAIRAPARGIVLFHLALAVLAAWGLSLFLRGRPKGRRLGWTAAAVLTLVLEYRAFPLVLAPTPSAPPPVYAWLARFDMPGAVVEWPFGLAYDFDYVFRQTAHGKPILNGYSGFFPKAYSALEDELKQRPIPNSVWSRMGELGASLLVYHAHEGKGYRVVGYSEMLDRALSEGRLELVRSFPHGEGRDFVFLSPATTWLDRARQGAGAPEETRRLYDAAVADLRRNVSLLSPPVGEIHLPEEGQRVEPGFWVHGWAVDDSGVAQVRFRAENGATGTAMPGGAWPGVAEVFPDYKEARDHSAFGFALPELPDGPHVLTVTVVGRDGGATALRRAITVKHAVPVPTSGP